MTKIVFSSKCLKYRDSGHPESPERIRRAAAFLKENGYSFVKAKKTKEKDVLAVHNQDLVNRVKNNNFFEASTPNIENIFTYALLAAGAAIQAAELALAKEHGFSLMRPPGHHAEKNRLGGFCYFNNMAVAVKHLVDKGKRIAIVDFDAHHGQGTENIFMDNDNVIMVSLHQTGIYPNTGHESIDNSYNFPMFELTGDEAYLEKFETGLNIITEFNPDVIAVSAGFDAYEGDPLTNMDLSLSVFRKIGARLASLHKPMFSVLEGGYSENLGECIYNYLQGVDNKC